MTTKPPEYWEEWFLEHRADELAVLVIESCRVLLRQGSMTAEDVHHIPVKNPSVRGSLMRQLSRMGLVEKEAFAVGSTERSHGHAMWKWRCANAGACRFLLDRCAGMVLPEKPAKTEQMELL